MNPNDVAAFLLEHKPMSIDQAKLVIYELGQRFSRHRNEADKLERRANQLSEWIKTMQRWQDFQRLVADAEQALKGEGNHFINPFMDPGHKQWPDPPAENLVVINPPAE